MYEDEEYIPREKKPVSEEVQRKTNRRITIVAVILIVIALICVADWSAKVFNEHTHIITVTDKEKIKIYRSGGKYSRGSSETYYYVYGIREDGKEIKYRFCRSYSFMDTANYVHYEQIKEGRTYQFTVTGFCFGDEIVLDHIVQINNPDEYIEQRERKGFSSEKFLMYFGMIWIAVIMFSFGIPLYVLKEKSSFKICLIIGSIIGLIVTFILFLIAMFVW